jgi:hypothetical protein
MDRTNSRFTTMPTKDVTVRFRRVRRAFRALFRVRSGAGETRSSAALQATAQAEMSNVPENGSFM